jgi:hypothetical protein
MRPEGLGKLKNFIHLIESRTLDFPTCSLMIEMFVTTDKIVNCYYKLYFFCINI